MEFGDLLRQQVNPVALKQLSLQQSVKPQFRIELVHFDRILDDIVAGAQFGSLTGTANGHDFDIDIRRQALIQPQLFLTAMPSLLQCGEVEEAEVDRFLDLVRIFTGQQQPGDVGFNHSD